MSSPVIARLMNEPSGRPCGKDAVRAYWAKALAQHPDLRFDVLHVLAGSSSVVIVHRGYRGLAAEAFWFDGSERACRAAAHYLA